MRAGVVFAGLALILAGCVSERHGAARAKDGGATAWHVGRTTARDVVAAWGNPDFVVDDTWVWWNVDALGGKVRVAYMGVGVTVSNLQQGMSEYRLKFGADGKLKAIDASQTLPGGPGWSLNPIGGAE